MGLPLIIRILEMRKCFASSLRNNFLVPIYSTSYSKVELLDINGLKSKQLTIVLKINFSISCDSLKKYMTRMNCRMYWTTSSQFYLVFLSNLPLMTLILIGLYLTSLVMSVDLLLFFWVSISLSCSLVSGKLSFQHVLYLSILIQR